MLFFFLHFSRGEDSIVVSFATMPVKNIPTIHTSWWEWIAHGAMFSTWCFLVIFGNVMEAQQMRDDVSLVCGDDVYYGENDGYGGESGDAQRCPSGLREFSADGVCCLAENSADYQNVYNILSVAGGTLGSVHLAYAFKTGVDLAFREIGGVLFVFQSLISGSSLLVCFVGVAYVYQHLAYHVFFCGYESRVCDHPPPEEGIIRNIFYSLLALAAPIMFVQICRIAALATVFANSRKRTLGDVMDLETRLDVFSDHIEGTFNEHVVSKYRNLKCFIKLWMDRNDEDVGGYLTDKAKAIMRDILSAAHEGRNTRSRKNMTTPARHESIAAGHEGDVQEITFADFRDFVRARVGQGKKDEAETRAVAKQVWDFLMKYEKRCCFGGDDDREGDGDGEDGSEENDKVSIVLFHSSSPPFTDEESPETPETKHKLTLGGLEEMLYELFFRRKELIHSIYTDHSVITFLSHVVVALLVPASLIAVSRIWGYQNAFGTGVDLFKTYILAASYILTGYKDNVAFMISMLTDRPFNLGDVLLIDGETYKVRRFSLTHVYMDGGHHISVPLVSFASGNTINLSKEGITDSIRIAVPLTLSSDKLDREKMYAILRSYQASNERDVQRSSLRCGWVAAEGGSGAKVMQCNWRYNFRIFDRSRLNWARTNIRHHVLEALQEDIGRAYLQIHVAGGGGLNELGESYLRHRRD